MLADLQSRLRDALVSGDAFPTSCPISSGDALWKAAASSSASLRGKPDQSHPGQVPGDTVASRFRLRDGGRRAIRPGAPARALHASPSMARALPHSSLNAHMQRATPNAFIRRVGVACRTCVGCRRVAVHVHCVACSGRRPFPPGNAHQASARRPLSSIVLACRRVVQAVFDQSAPDRLVFDAADALLEIRGARGEFRLNRLARGEFAFRDAIADGQTVAGAAARALDASDDLDVGGAFANLFAEGLVVACMRDSEQQP